MLLQGLIDVAICTAITAGVVALLVVAHVALVGRDAT